MRKSVVVALVLVLVVVLGLALTGCGGGGDTAETTAPATDQAAAPPPAPVEGATIGDRSANVTSTFEPFPTGEFVPADLKANIDAKRPTLVFFYDSSNTSDQNRSIIDTVRSENRGMVDLVAYDIGKYTSASQNGVVTVDPALANDPIAKQAVQLAQALGVTSPPYVVLTDNQGYIIWEFRGLLDAVFLEREVQRAAG